MYEIVLAKFTQHPELAEVQTGKGENRLGKILMKVRSELKETYHR